MLSMGILYPPKTSVFLCSCVMVYYIQYTHTYTYNETCVRVEWIANASPTMYFFYMYECIISETPIYTHTFQLMYGLMGYLILGYTYKRLYCPNLRSILNLVWGFVENT